MSEPSITAADQHDDGSADRSVIDILSDIKRSALSARSLDPETRIRCVEYLCAEGASVPEIAQLLGRNERTIRRDLERIRAEHAIVVDDEFALRLAGEFLHEARASIARIRRVTREKDCPHASRIEGERVTMEITDRCIARLQSLGYLPMATRGIRAEVTHMMGGVVEVESLQTEVRRLRELPAGATDPRLEMLEAITVELDGITGEAPSC